MCIRDSYSTGFYFGKPDEDSQVYTSSSYIRDYDLVGIVEEYDPQTRIAKISQRNKFSEGEEMEVLQPGKPFFKTVARNMKDADGLDITSAPHATMTVYMPLNGEAVSGAMLRREKKKNL